MCRSVPTRQPAECAGTRNWGAIGFPSPSRSCRVAFGRSGAHGLPGGQRDGEFSVGSEFEDPPVIRRRHNPHNAMRLMKSVLPPLRHHKM